MLKSAKYMGDITPSITYKRSINAKLNEAQMAGKKLCC